MTYSALDVDPVAGRIAVAEPRATDRLSRLRELMQLRGLTTSIDLEISSPRVSTRANGNGTAWRTARRCAPASPRPTGGSIDRKVGLRPRVRVTPRQVGTALEAALTPSGFFFVTVRFSVRSGTRPSDVGDPLPPGVRRHWRSPKVTKLRRAKGGL